MMDNHVPQPIKHLNKRLEEAEADVRSSCCWICGSDDGHIPRDCKEVRFIPCYMMDYQVPKAIGQFEIIQTVHHRGIDVASRIFNLPISEVKKIVFREINYHTDIVKSHKNTLDILNKRLREKDQYVRSDCLICGSEGRLEEVEEDVRSRCLICGSDDEDIPPDARDHKEVRFIPFRGVPCYKCGKVGHLATFCKPRCGIDCWSGPAFKRQLNKGDAIVLQMHASSRRQPNRRGLTTEITVTQAAVMTSTLRRPLTTAIQDVQRNISDNDHGLEMMDHLTIDPMKSLCSRLVEEYFSSFLWMDTRWCRQRGCTPYFIRSQQTKLRCDTYSNIRNNVQEGSSAVIVWRRLFSFSVV
ncbi:DNA-binding protein HEXBP [Tanacetum coccineum]